MLTASARWLTSGYLHSCYSNTSADSHQAGGICSNAADSNNAVTLTCTDICSFPWSNQSDKRRHICKSAELLYKLELCSSTNTGRGGVFSLASHLIQYDSGRGSLLSGRRSLHCNQHCRNLIVKSNGRKHFIEISPCWFATEYIVLFLDIQPQLICDKEKIKVTATLLWSLLQLKLALNSQWGRSSVTFVTLQIKEKPPFSKYPSQKSARNSE